MKKGAGVRFVSANLHPGYVVLKSEKRSNCLDLPLVGIVPDVLIAEDSHKRLFRNHSRKIFMPRAGLPALF